MNRAEANKLLQDIEAKCQAMEGMNNPSLNMAARKLREETKARVERECPPSKPASAYCAKLLEKLLTVDNRMNKLKHQACLVANYQDSVLIMGESGTGKELIAQALHGERKGNYVSVNCAGFPEQLIESELFGHERGSFSGADREKMGLFECADGGTLFLDEIGDMPMEAQAKLLRVLQTGEVRRVGGNVPKRFEVRVVAATHYNLPERVMEKKFRLDLYARLSTVELVTIPLRNRRDDIKLIVEKLDTTGNCWEEIGKIRRESFETCYNEVKEVCEKISIGSSSYWEYNDFPLNVRDIQKIVRRWELFGEL